MSYPKTLDDLAHEVHEINKSKGFWDGSRDELAVLMLITTEVSEAAEAIRDGDSLNEMRYTVDFQGNQKPVGVPSEMADVIIRVLDACAAWDIDIDRAVREKIEYNRTRPALHGRAR